MNKLIILILALALISSASALEECGFSTPTNQICSIVTPFLSCEVLDLDIFQSDGTPFKADGALSQIGTSSIYNHSVNFTAADTYIVKLCDDSVRSITVIDLNQLSESVSWWSYLLQIFYNTLPGAW